MALFAHVFQHSRLDVDEYGDSVVDIKRDGRPDDAVDAGLGDRGSCGVHDSDGAGADDLGDRAGALGHGAADQQRQFDPGQQLGRDEYGGDIFQSGTQRDLNGGARAGAGGFGWTQLCV